MLHTGLLLAADLLHAHLPEDVNALVRQDALAAKLVARILRWLPGAGHTPPALFERAAFRLRMRGGLLAAPAYLLRLSLSPTEEDCKRAEKSATTICSTRCVAHSGWRGSMAAAEKTPIRKSIAVQLWKSKRQC